MSQLNTAPLKTSLRILVVRNDKLGDFMLAWPALALLKRSLPEAKITVLVPAYTRELAAACPWVDNVLLDPQELDQATKKNFDAVLTLFSTGRVGWQVFKGCIPLRVAPATKWAQIFYNRRVVQRRSRSEKPEYAYNLDLAKYLLLQLGVQAKEVTAPYWPLPKEERFNQRRILANSLGLNDQDGWFFVHPGSGGSAVNISLEQFAALMVGVQEKHADLGRSTQWVITAGPGEEAQAQALLALLPAHVRAVVYASNKGLLAFAQSLLAADMFIAGSTGPLHIAGALNVPTVGFFPVRRSATSLRWRPCNGAGRTLAFSPSAGGESDMAQIDISQAADNVAVWKPE